MTQPAPGWYPAPDGQPYERWWGGTEWTDATRPPPAASVPAPKVLVTRQPVRTSHTFHLLMTLLTCGVWGLLVWLPMTVLNSLRTRKVTTRLRY